MIVDWVDWLISGGLLVHTTCGTRGVKVKQSFKNSWAFPDFYCETCRRLVVYLEVPEWSRGEMPEAVTDIEDQRLEEIM